MESPADSQCSEAELREAAIELAADLRDQFRSIGLPSFAAQVDRVRDALAESDTPRAVAIWAELVPKVPAAAPRRRMVAIEVRTGLFASVLSELKGSQVAEPDIDTPVPPSSFGSAVKRCILVLVGTACLAFGVTILRLPERERGEEIIWIGVGALFVIAGPVFVVRALIGGREQVDKDFWKLLDGL